MPAQYFGEAGRRRNRKGPKKNSAEGKGKKRVAAVATLPVIRSSVSPKKSKKRSSSSSNDAFVLHPVASRSKKQSPAIKTLRHVQGIITKIKDMFKLSVTKTKKKRGKATGVLDLVQQRPKKKRSIVT